MNCFGRTRCHCEILLFVVYGMTLNAPDAKRKTRKVCRSNTCIQMYGRFDEREIAR